eukprot:CAMPEP_0204824628 /NCGR_PEP_ID=MMETSP1346-20131115/2630_1 /ASSEMBLY_ACC=CAM_ASM_000771 /TAXON_ID=215587 /ORGANISM="Aplanochytrium stocchinoi, Strain GSBS06" /LENGTH=378 /DNA_ID=CAMNT_0051951883 /DNA_START=26 /DNA_END=1162 /DNA_ORIENTATION=+
MGKADKVGKPKGGKGQVDLYEFLKVSKTADAKEIRKAYYALARLVHPDKNPDDPKADERFQSLQKAYAILKDPQKRNRYDRTGCSDDDNDAFWDAYERYRGIQVTEDDIVNFQNGYRQSKEEEQDLIDFIKEKKGDVRKILGYIIASRDEDKERFVSFFESQFKEGKLDTSLRDCFDKSKSEICSLEELDKVEDIGEEDDDDEEDDEEGQGDDLDDFIAPEDDEAEKENVGDGADSDYGSDADADKKSFKKGDEVQCRWKGGKKYYAATIIEVRKDGTYDVHYEEDDATEEKVVAKFIKTSNKKQTKNQQQKKRTASSSPTTTRKRPKRSPKKPVKHDDSEYGDIDALRAAIFGGGRAEARASNFDEFEAKWTKKPKK